MKFNLTFFLLFTCFLSWSQLQEGVLVYSMTQEWDDESEMIENIQQETTLTLTFAPNQTRTSVQVGTEMNVTSIIQHADKKGLILMSGMMGNLAIAATYEELTENTSDTDVEIQFLESTQKIKGYVCKKARITDATGAIITYWYTEEILFEKSGIENMYDALPGTPLEFRIESEGMTTIFTLEEIKTKVSDISQAFSMLTPEGYKSLTMEQFEMGEF